MFMTESSLVSSLHDTMAPGSSRTAVGGVAAPGRKNRVRRGRGRGEAAGRERQRRGERKQPVRRHGDRLGWTRTTARSRTHGVYVLGSLDNI